MKLHEKVHCLHENLDANGDATPWTGKEIHLALKTQDKVTFKYLWEHHAPWTDCPNEKFFSENNIDLDTTDCRQILYCLLLASKNASHWTHEGIPDNLRDFFQVFNDGKIEDVAHSLWCENEPELRAALISRIKYPSTTRNDCAECFRLDGLNVKG